jgi:hypothetical protein
VGAAPYRGGAGLVAAPVARLLGVPVVMPRSPLRTYLADSDHELVSRRFGGPRLSLVARDPDRAVVEEAHCLPPAGSWDSRGICSLLNDWSAPAGVDSRGVIP